MRIKGTIIYKLLVLCFVFLIFAGCSKEQEFKSIKDLMRNQENSANMVVIADFEHRKEIMEKNSIEEIVKTISDIQVKELIKKEELKLLDNGKRFEDENYGITVFNDRNVIALLTIFSDGDLIAFDVKMGDQTGRTKSYLAINVNKNDLKKIFDIIDKNRE
jgi:hypothetical protein